MGNFLEGLCVSNARPVMPLDVLGCTLAIHMSSASLRSCPKWLGIPFKIHRESPGAPIQGPISTYVIRLLNYNYLLV